MKNRVSSQKILYLLTMWEILEALNDEAEWTQILQSAVSNWGVPLSLHMCWQIKTIVFFLIHDKLTKTSAGYGQWSVLQTFPRFFPTNYQILCCMPSHYWPWTSWYFCSKGSSRCSSPFCRCPRYSHRPSHNRSPCWYLLEDVPPLSLGSWLEMNERKKKINKERTVRCLAWGHFSRADSLRKGLELDTSSWRMALSLTLPPCCLWQT